MEKVNDFGEPWRLSGSNNEEIVDCHGCVIYSGMDVLEPDEMNRIIACVNALQGIDSAAFGRFSNE